MLARIDSGKPKNGKSKKDSKTGSRKGQIFTANALPGAGGAAGAPHLPPPRQNYGSNPGHPHSRHSRRVALFPGGVRKSGSPGFKKRGPSSATRTPCPKSWSPPLHHPCRCCSRTARTFSAPKLCPKSCCPPLSALSAGSALGWGGKEVWTTRIKWGLRSPCEQNVPLLVPPTFIFVHKYTL